MAARTRRARWLAVAVCIAIVFLIYERRAIENASYPDYLNIGGGSVLRNSDGSEKFPDPGPPIPAAPPSEPMIKDSNPLKPVEPESKPKLPEEPAPEIKNPTLPEPEPEPLPALPTLPATPAEKPAAFPANDPVFGGEDDAYGYPGRIDPLYKPTTTTPAAPVHWTKQPEKYPITSKIKLPTGSPKPIPRIQYSGKGGAEPERLAAVKKAAKHAWDGYREYGWGYDEVKPVSGKGKDSFNGWGATLVDSLDTLWIMGMKDEFEDAVNQTSHIDFTTSPKNEIPMFEVTIRYLGGLIAAYDVSGGKYKVLLDKAVELGEILYSAFDTPNRMPETYYQWKPRASTLPYFSSTRDRVVLAELGTLSLEFTRLAQLSGEAKYYDAIARITDAFDEWQNRTRLPGMWPISVDASGCAKPVANTPSRTGPKQLPVGPNGNSYMMTSEPVMGGGSPGGKIGKPWHEAQQADEESGVEKTGKAKIEAPSKAGDLTVEAPKKASDSKVGGPKKPSTADKGVESVKAPPAEPDAAALANAEKTLMESMNHDAHMDAAMEAMDKNVANPMAHTGKSSDLRNPSEHAPAEPSYEKRTDKAAKEKRQLDADDVDADIGSGSDAVRGSGASLPASDKYPSHSTGGGGHRNDFSVHNGASKQTPAETASPKGEEIAEPECIPQGFESPSKMAMETFTLGGQSDSLYEYFPKEWVLLGGLVPQYKDMYLKSTEAIIKNLLFRPMTPNNADILVSGELKSYINYTTEEPYEELVAKNEHLTCFAGGMFAMGGKLFNQPEHIEIGRKLTDGCVWSYNATASGIMPETLNMIACKDEKDCKWNETKYWEELDPYRQYREEQRVQFFIDHPDYDESEGTTTAATVKATAAPNAKTVPAHPKPASLAYADEDEPPLDDMPLSGQKTVPARSKPGSVTYGSRAPPLDAPQVLDTGDDADGSDASSKLKRRQLEDYDSDEEIDDTSTKQTSTVPEKVPAPAAAAGPAIESSPAINSFSNLNDDPDTLPSDATVPETDPYSFPVYVPKPPMTHQQYIAMRLKDDRLPLGFTQMDRKYILRPEAIESVFYMYRITGEQYWRDVGWKMFQSVETATRTNHGHSAVHDVTMEVPQHKDEMESFWLAETLKYYYLLFEEPERWSLDDWVLNTEAHFFKRPDAKGRA
jgi:mannosyl-oligosaccharide alpha-1,2-mannosidase